MNTIEKNFFSLPPYIVADAGYGSEQNYGHVFNNRQRTPLITYSMYRKEKKRAYRNNAFNVANWHFNQEDESFICPNGKKVNFRYYSNKTDQAGFQRTFKVYECEDCSGCPFRAQCTKAKEGNNRKIYYNEKWENQKASIREMLLETETGVIYGKRKIDVEPVFGFLKANLHFTRMAVNLRKYTAHELHGYDFDHKKRLRLSKNDNQSLFLLY